MASLYITEFKGIGRDRRGTEVQAAPGPALTQQKVTYAASTQSAPFAQSTGLVRLTADADAHIKFGDDPSATANDMLLPNGAVEYFTVIPGDKLAAYDGTT
jgi:hypothetical protein